MCLRQLIVGWRIREKSVNTWPCPQDTQNGYSAPLSFHIDYFSCLFNFYHRQKSFSCLNSPYVAYGQILQQILHHDHAVLITAPLPFPSEVLKNALRVRLSAH